MIALGNTFDRTLGLLACALFGFMALISSCKGQIKDGAPVSFGKGDIVAYGDTVNEWSEHIWYIFQDSNDNYWFGSNGEGVFRYDGKTIINFTTRHGLCNDSIRQIQEGGNGNMYFSTLGGINQFDGRQFTKLRPVKSKDWKKEPNDLWFSILGKRGENGPYRFDGTTLFQLEFPKHFLHEELYSKGINPFFSPYEVYCIYKDRKGDMWFGTSVFGACRFDGHSVKWMYEEDLTIAPEGGTFGIRSIYEDQEGQFWLCNTWHRYIFDLPLTSKSDKLEYKKISGVGNPSLFEGAEYIYYSYIVEDDIGAIWLTTWDRGVFRYDGNNLVQFVVKDGAEDVNLVSMYKDKRGALWLGTLNNGVFKFNGATFEKFM